MKIKYIILVCLLLVGCRNNELETISKNLDINVRDGEIIVYEDERGWFNDGETYAKIQFHLNSIESNIKNNIAWKDLPFDNNIEMILYGNDESNSILVDGESRIPKISNGYYYFKDKQGNDENLFDRNSYNFILSIYDSDMKVLYYIEIDT